MKDIPCLIGRERKKHSLPKKNYDYLKLDSGTKPEDVCLISGSSGAADSFGTTSPRSPEVLDIFLSRDLQSHMMIGWVNGNKDAHSAIAAEKETLIPLF